MFQPWLVRDLGEPQAYPTAYLIGFIIWPLSVLPAATFTFLFVYSIAGSAAGAGAAIARVVCDNPLAELACALFAVFNPWVYTELVAGHVFMVMSYGFILWLTSEILRPKPRSARLVLWSALLVCQIEFLMFAIVPMTIWLLRTRRFLALAALLTAAFPIAFGILTHYQEVRSTPYLLEWQASQSIALGDALLLRGYFTHYAAAFGSVSIFLCVLAAVALVATALAVYQKTVGWGILVAGWVASIVATGTKWILAPLYTLIVLHVPESGIFRELYDVIAFSVVAYAVGITVVARVNRTLSFILLSISIALAYPWFVSPPYTWFVAQQLVPIQQLPGSSGERVALFPPAQPLQLRSGAGSGLDPDLYYQTGKAIPLNAFFPDYPTVSALARSRSSDFSELKALSVRYLIARPYLREHIASLTQEMVTPGESAHPASQSLTGSFPMLGTIAAAPQVVSIGRSASGNAVFFGDAPENIYGRMKNTQFSVMRSSRLGTDPSSGWIDARLAFFTYPQTSTRFGGVFTRSHAALLLPASSRPFVLAWTDGSLSDASGRIVARPTGELAWWPLATGTLRLKCTGACTVVAVGNPPAVPAEGRTIIPSPVQFHMIAPWLIRASLPAHGNALLRWNTRYERSWVLTGVTTRAHLRIDQVLNGWLLDRGPASTAYILNLTAAIQLTLEVLSFLIICVILRRASLHA